jgi:hypothetical protein
MRLFSGLVLLLMAAGGLYAWYLQGGTPPRRASTPVVSEEQPRREQIPPRPAAARTDPYRGAAARAPVADEATLMQQLREHVRSNPALAEALAREGRRRFPDSADSDERDALLVDALLNQQRIGVARSETYYYLDHHRNGRYAEHLFVMTGVRPEPEPPR